MRNKFDVDEARNESFNFKNLKRCFVYVSRYSKK